jgi:hypothetical protein
MDPSPSLREREFHAHQARALGAEAIDGKKRMSPWSCRAARRALGATILLAVHSLFLAADAEGARRRQPRIAIQSPKQDQLSLVGEVRVMIRLYPTRPS